MAEDFGQIYEHHKIPEWYSDYFKHKEMV